MKGLILAGGKGTRLRPLTINTPKPVVPVANAPFLLYQIDLMRSGGIEEIILSLSYQPRKIEDLLKDGSDYGVWIRYAVEGTPLGTGGAFKNAEEQIDSTTVVFNGDVLTSIDLSAVVARHREKRAIATLVLTPVENPSAYGLVETSPEGWVQRFVEKPGPDEITCNTINAGIYILEPSVLNYMPKGEPYSFERGLLPTLPAGATVDEKSIIDQGVTIRSGVRIENSVIGRNCKIDEGAQIIDSVVWSGNTIDADARVNGSIVGKGCYIGRSATLRDGVVLGDKTVVTDFSQL